MDNFKENVSNFVLRVRDFIPLEFRQVIADDGIQLQSDLYLLVIYYPKRNRIADDPERKTIHIDYDIVICHPNKLLARLKSVLGFGQRVFARSTVVARIDKKTGMEFQEDHHLQGALPGKYRYGLYLNGDLVSVAVFSGGRKMNDTPEAYRSFELLRFCHKGSILVVGGLSKLINKFVADFKPGDIMTYSDLDWSQDSGLEKIGFEAVNKTAPQRFLISRGARNHFGNSDLTASEGDYWVENKGSLKLKLFLLKSF